MAARLRTGEAPANVTQPILCRGGQSKKRQACVQWFYEGKLADHWLKPSPVGQQAFGSEARLGDGQLNSAEKRSADWEPRHKC
jgi:hypothetical protein